MSKNKTALYIGRFQPWHIGHGDALGKMLQDCKKVKIVIGSSQVSRTPDNPWTATEREKIILQSIDLADKNKYDNNTSQTKLKTSNFKLQTSNSTQKAISFYHLPDIPGNDTLWLENLEKTVGKFDVIYSGNPWLKDICSEFDISFKWINYEIDVSGTQIRDMLSKGDDVSLCTHVKKLP